MRRTNSAAGAQSGAADGFETIEEDGVTYLAQDVVAQREGVYHYPDPSGGIRKELAPAEELSDAIEGVDEVPLVVSHPESPDGDAAMTSDSRANFAEVGSWRDLRETRDGDGIAGRVFIRQNEVGEHEGTLRSYINAVRQRGIGEVSTGYNIQKAEKSPGRYNGTRYEYVQRGIQLDHLALLPEEQGDCSVEDGCGLGRANQSDENRIRTNHHHPESADDGGDGPNPPEDSGFSPMEVRFNADIEYKRTTEEISDSTSFTDEEWNAGQVTSSLPNPSENEDAPQILDEVYAISPTGEEARDSKKNWKLPYKSGPDAPINTRALVQIDSVLSGGRGGVEGVSDSLTEDVEQWAQRALKKAPADLYGATEEERQNILAEVGQRALGMIGTLTTSAKSDGGEGPPRTNHPDDGGLTDREKVDQLVEQYSFTRENIAPLKGTTCLSRIHEAVVDEESETTENMEDNPDDPEDGEQLSEEEIREVVRDEAEEVVEEQMDDLDFSVSMDDLDTSELADTLAGEVEEARANEKHIEKVAASDEIPLEREQLERMNEDVVADIAEDIEDSEEDARANFAGRPTGSSFDESEFSSEDDGPEVPSAGGGLVGESEGDD